MERAAFLAEISRSLGRPLPSTAPARTLQHRAPFAAPLPAGELGERFRDELSLVGGEVVLAASAEHARATLALELSRARRVVTWARSELPPLPLDELWQQLGERCVPAGGADFREAALGADVGVTGVDCAVAETGTLLLSARAGRPRSVSLLPRLHIALIMERQLVSRMGSGFVSHRQRMPSALIFVTGPSRTSDIENDLSIGVHGPARVLAIVVPEVSA